ncbi:MAG: VOC family protein [Frankiaceae bacterium]
MAELPPRLSVITLGTRALPRMRQFYSGLGWTEVGGSTDDWAAFLLGGTVLALYPMDELMAEAVPDGSVSATDTGFSGVILACDVDSEDQVDVAFQAAVAAGATPVAEPVAREWGGRSGYIADPEGNRWEIAWVPSAKFNERGAVTSFG